MILSNGKLREIAEGRIAGTEIVHCNSVTLVRETFWRVASVASGILQKNCLGDFEFEAIGGQAGRHQGSAHSVYKMIVVLELRRGYIDCDADIMRPSRGILARRSQHPITNRDNQTSFFREAKKFRRKNQSALWVFFQRNSASKQVTLLALMSRSGW